jgi:hypothetical protein
MQRDRDGKDDRVGHTAREKHMGFIEGIQDDVMRVAWVTNARAHRGSGGVRRET